MKLLVSLNTFFNEQILMKILIVGLGSIGTRHAKNFSQLGYDNLVGFDPLPDRRRVFKKELSCKVVSTLDDGLNEQPDLCVIASPNCFHIEQAIKAAKHGCHLFIEKPLSNSRYYLPELTQTVKDKDLFVHVGSNWKFHPAFKTMKKILSDQILGKITGTQILAGQWLPDWHPWEDYRNMYSSRKSLGGGVVLDSHEFDYVSWLLGKIKKVYGFVQHTGILEIETEDVAVFMDATHYCVKARGIMDTSSRTETRAMGGRFKSDTNLRQNFLNTLR